MAAIAAIAAIGGFGLCSRAYGLRLRDMNISEWFFAPMFVIPLVMELFYRVNGLYTWLIHIGTLILMLCIPGSSGENKYGPASKQGSPIPFFILMTLSCLGGLLTLAMVALDLFYPA